MEPQDRPRAAATTAAHSTERTQGEMGHPWEIPEGRKEMKTSRQELSGIPALTTPS